jgi:hypothetical protein
MKELITDLQWLADTIQKGIPIKVVVDGHVDECTDWIKLLLSRIQELEKQIERMDNVFNEIEVVAREMSSPTHQYEEVVLNFKKLVVQNYKFKAALLQYADEEMWSTGSDWLERKNYFLSSQVNCSDGYKLAQEALKDA